MEWETGPVADALQANADRFSGFVDLYDRVRPGPPEELAEILTRYVGGRAKRVVDIGSGTGLSTRWASRWAEEVIGIEPSDDMRAIAEATAAPNTSFRSGWSHATGLAGQTADVVLAVQALHWMEPTSTFTEVSRLLRPGGVFAAVDCDWPPVVGDHEVERAWATCRRRIWTMEHRFARELEGDSSSEPFDELIQEPNERTDIDAHRKRQLVDGVRSWPKSEHLERMSASGQFCWCREVVLSSTEEGDADRLIGLLKSQGDYQALRRHGLEDRELGVETFEAVVRARTRTPRTFRFPYRARLGFKTDRCEAG